MNDPITLPATDPEDRRETPETTRTDAPDPEPVRTLLNTAATCRPLAEVTALVSLLKDSGQSDPGHEALRTAAVARPVHEVREMVALLGETPHEGDAAAITLRAAAVGRPIEEVALLASILGTEEADQAGQPPPSQASDAPGPVPPEPSGPPGTAQEAYAREPSAQAEPAEAQHAPGTYAPPHRERRDAPDAQPSRRARPDRRDPARPRPARSGPAALRHVLRWPVATALLVTAAPHLPADLAALGSARPLDLLPLLVAVLCIGFGVLLAVRDTAPVWRAAAVTALGVVALHVCAGVTAFDPLAGAVGGTVGWAGSIVMLSAAAGAVLAGAALANRREGAA